MFVQPQMLSELKDAFEDLDEVFRNDAGLITQKKAWIDEGNR